MWTNKIKAIVKHTMLAAVIVAMGGSSAMAASYSDAVLAAKKQETILAPVQIVPGCWTDEGYGRISSCDAG